ncbi:conserved hypothetical protein [Burkholderia diffusa]|nr:hypothetical protein WS46_22975 [Burkholderia sp. RF4-BP95]KUY98260.1 hypothetical protein WS48_10915 [Burkholderia sp. RF7-non_BP1]KUZ02596.1 hypothetical protein WS49_11650 [Burkholderia sp. RF7-non_BP4]CAG9260485.1 conserved hypothetical protein [Burkholderia diffusa]
MRCHSGASHAQALESPIAKPVRFRVPRYHRAVSQRVLIQDAAFFRNAGRRDPADFFQDPP